MIKDSALNRLTHYPNCNLPLFNCSYYHSAACGAKAKNACVFKPRVGRIRHKFIRHTSDADCSEFPPFCMHFAS
jgi:hypothetical protein